MTSAVVFAVVAVVAIVLIVTIERMTTAIQDFARMANKERKRSDNLIKQMLPTEVSRTPRPRFIIHYGDVIMSAIASQITSLTIVYSTVYSDADQRKRQSFASLAFVWGIHRGPGTPSKCSIDPRKPHYGNWAWNQTNAIDISWSIATPYTQRSWTKPLSVQCRGGGLIQRAMLWDKHSHHLVWNLMIRWLICDFGIEPAAF